MLPGRSAKIFFIAGLQTQTQNQTNRYAMRRQAYHVYMEPTDDLPDFDDNWSPANANARTKTANSNTDASELDLDARFESGRLSLYVVFNRDGHYISAP
jgi:hypothetical protein